MAHEFKIQRQVEFSDTDMAGIVHFSRFFQYMEAVEHAFYRSLGFSVHFKEGDRQIGFPRVDAQCTYKTPLRFEESVEIHLFVQKRTEKTITYELVFSKISSDEKIEVARGHLSVVCVEFNPDMYLVKSIPIPKNISDLIEVAPDYL